MQTKIISHMAAITIGSSAGRGRGVFAARRFEPGETIEVCPVIALSEADARTLDGTGLYDYYFGWGEDGKAAAITLGYGSLSITRRCRMRCIESITRMGSSPSLP